MNHLKRQWRSADGLVHIMKMKAFGPRTVCYGPYIPAEHTLLSDEVPTCLRCIYNDTYYPSG
jgi:hypothetical protein